MRGMETRMKIAAAVMAVVLGGGVVAGLVHQHSEDVQQRQDIERLRDALGY